jgi:acyl-CoA synthetase (AMP-forming)/AMP-acid ligase II
VHLGLVLDMTDAGIGERPAITADNTTLSYGELARCAWQAAACFTDLGVPAVVYIGGNHLAFPVALFGAAAAGIPFAPLNYRLSGQQLDALIDLQPGAFVICDVDLPVQVTPELRSDPVGFIDSLDSWAGVPPTPADPEDPAIFLHTSGTTSAPKTAVLRHRHLMAYLFGTVEFDSASETDAALVSVPAYHIAGIANLLSNVFAGRRVVYLDRFDPDLFLETIRSNGITQAMVIPTMLARLVAYLEGGADASVPTLRHLSYGGARMPSGVLRRALELFPDVDFVNAYGLTETSSTISLLGPNDHRVSAASDDAAIAKRLESVGRPVPGIELEIRDDADTPVAPGQTGIIHVRGEQIAGEYLGASALDRAGWFSTRDRGWVDDAGYLFIEGRSDDTIIRGGENIAPAEIEDVLLAHPNVIDAVAVGLPDDEWGQRLAAVIVEGPGPSVSSDDIKEWVRRHLRSSKTPETVEIWTELPRTETGKLLRREVVATLTDG